MTLSDAVLYALCLGWGVLCGAIVYEHLAVIPQWVKEPPASLSMWRGPHGLKAERFWLSIHPVNLVLLAIALATQWSVDERRTLLLVVLGGFVVVFAATGAWYVPELLKLTRDPDAPIPPDEWRRRAKRWELLCYPRSVICVLLLLPLLRVLAST